VRANWRRDRNSGFTSLSSQLPNRSPLEQSCE